MFLIYSVNLARQENKKIHQRYDPQDIWRLTLKPEYHRKELGDSGL